MRWLNPKIYPPPKEEPFLSWDGERQCMATWFYASWACSCCNGYCSIDVKKWMPLPQDPE